MAVLGVALSLLMDHPSEWVVAVQNDDEPFFG